MGHYHESYAYEQEMDEKYHLENGYVRIPSRISRFFDNATWIHQDELKILREWLNDCPFCKLRGNDE